MRRICSLDEKNEKGFVLNNSNMEDIARKYLGELGVDISPDEIVGELPVSKQQMIRDCKSTFNQCKDPDHG